MTHQEYIADRCAGDPEFARDYYSPERDWFLAGAIAHHHRTRSRISLARLSRHSRVPVETIKSFENGHPISAQHLQAIIKSLPELPTQETTSTKEVPSSIPISRLRHHLGIKAEA